MGGSKDVHLVPAPDDSTAVVAFQAADRARCQQREDEEPDGHDGAHLRASFLPALTLRGEKGLTPPEGVVRPGRVRADSGRTLSNAQCRTRCTPVPAFSLKAWGSSLGPEHRE